MDPTLTPKTKLRDQVASDLDRDEGFREFAYPDPLSPLAKQYPASRYKWGFRPAREILAEVGVKVEDAERLGAPWTYGYGFTQGGNVDSRIDKQLARRKLEAHILEEDVRLDRTLSWYRDTSFVTKTVLINMSFNMGLKGLLGFRNTLNYMGIGNWKQAAANMRKNLWYQQVGSRAEYLSKRIETQTIASEHLPKVKGVTEASKPNFSNVTSGVKSTYTKDA